VVAVAFSLLYIVIGFVLLLADTSYYSLTMLALASYCVSIFTNMGIIFAQKQRNPDYYLPYLVYQVKKLFMHSKKTRIID
jgi:hypothetical protein